MVAVVRRIKEISLGAPLNKEMRELNKSINTLSNKEICKFLQGT